MSEVQTVATAPATPVPPVIGSRETPVPEVNAAAPVVTPPVVAAPETVVTDPNKPTTSEPPKDPNAPKVPEKYELKVPEGSLLDTSHAEKIAAFAKEQGFSQEQAQTFLERDASLIQEYSESQTNQLYDMSEQWRTQIETDKEFGGERFKESVVLANAVVNKYFSQDFAKLLETTRYGNHPDLFKGLCKIGKELDAGKLVLGGVTTPAKTLAPHEKFYGPDQN